MKKKLIILIAMMFLLSGCAKQLVDEDNKVVKNPDTGQKLTENILCQPQEDSIKKLYSDNGVDITQLPKCEDFTLTTGNYEGIWTSVFVKPLVWLLIQVGKLLNDYGLSIIVTTLLFRTLLSPITKKSADQSEKMKLAKPELDTLEKKYSNKSSTEEMTKKSQETMIIYKKHGINPASGCLFSFIQIPLLFAYYEAIMRLPTIFEGSLFGFKLGINPTDAISNGQYHYFIFTILIVVATYYSFKLTGTTATSSAQEKQMKTMMNFMVVMIFVVSLGMPIGLSIYWITGNLFTISQNLLSNRRYSK
jgi:YidC/Oxa1 family membrane protein insertase